MRRLAPIAVVLVVAATTARAQPSRYGLGRTPTKTEIDTLDISVSPDGRGLPVGQGSSRDGAALYQSLCAACHGARGEGHGDLPALVGGIGSLATPTPVLTVGSYWPYATTLWDYIRRAMPYLAPGELTADQVYAITAYILELNGVIPAGMTLTAASLPQIRMPNRDGFVADPRPDVR